MIKIVIYLCTFSDEVFRNQDQGTPATNRTVSAADVVLFGVNIVLPLMSQDLLKVIIILKKQLYRCSSYSGVFTLTLFLFQFPSLCNQYYKLITFICEIFPEKIPQLPEELFKSLMYSLELGMTSYPFGVHAKILRFYWQESGHKIHINDTIYCDTIGTTIY